jgi:hypothetical protein
MTDKPIPVLEPTTAEIVSQLRAKEEAQQLARVAAAGWSSPQEQRHRYLEAFEQQWTICLSVTDTMSS